MEKYKDLLLADMYDGKLQKLLKSSGASLPDDWIDTVFNNDGIKLLFDDPATKGE